MLAFAGASLFPKLFAGELKTAHFDVDRLLDTNAGSAGEVRRRFYVASATFTLFSIPLGTKGSVGSGYTVIEEAAGPAGKTLAIQFGAGSWPESAHGLNRLGYIQEAVFEDNSGGYRECAYVAFMTTSQEKSLDQAKKALAKESTLVPYSAAQGCGQSGKFASRVDLLEFPSKFTWRDLPELVKKAREEMAANTAHLAKQTMEATAARPSTFLHVVREALLDPKDRTTGYLFFNSKQFQLQTEKENDLSAGVHFAERQLVSRADSVIRLNAMLTERRSGEKTPFRLWYERGAEQMPPLKFEYQAKSFLRLSFEVDASAVVPDIRPALENRRKE